MALFNEVTPLPRRSRNRISGNTHTPKARPIMKLEWSKLLAEATEKDMNADTNHEYDVDEDDDTNREDENVSNTKGEEGEMPLNLCYRSNTMPSLGTELQKSLVLDLSSEKNNHVVVNCVAWQARKSSCTVPNFQTFNSKSKPPSSHQVSFDSKEIKEEKEVVLNDQGENQSNVLNARRNLDYEINKVKVDEELKKDEKRVEIVVAEEKPVVNHVVECQKIQAQEINKPRERSSEREKKNEEAEEIKNVQEKQPQSQSQCVDDNRFAVPKAPPKPEPKIVKINAKSYTILSLLGKGGSSRVYLVFSSEQEILAVKRVKLSGVDPKIRNDYLNEIQHLLKMQHSKHVIKLYDHQYKNAEKLLYVVMERGDTDLSRFLKDKATSDEGISPQLIMYYWTEMLLAVKSIHDNNIIHRDLKPANFLLVSGRLKLIDFGIASAIQTEQTSILTDTQSGTFNYMSPEALKCPAPGSSHGQKIGRKTDVWSLGCILYYFLYKKTPFQEYMSIHHKISAITDPQHVVKFPKVKGVPEILIESCKKCLIHDVKQRASIEDLLALSREPLLSLSQVLTRLKPALSPDEYNKAVRVLDEDDETGKTLTESSEN